MVKIRENPYEQMDDFFWGKPNYFLETSTKQ